MKRDFKQCDICKEYHWTDESCAPIYYFKHEGWGDEFQEIRACNFNDAALKFAELYNSDGDYALMNSEETVIISDGKTEKTFCVSAEPDIFYSATEVEEWNIDG